MSCLRVHLSYRRHSHPYYNLQSAGVPAQLLGPLRPSAHALPVVDDHFHDHHRTMAGLVQLDAVERRGDTQVCARRCAVVLQAERAMGNVQRGVRARRGVFCCY